ncbi:metallophosphoesterase [Nocardioides antri]|uniref:Metallophosphoesterase n=1 Tax=Nocardioides antri TaxID=2607659 RepID=A0A5B1M9Q6_9ACTN|nr:metallophosphoesterase [Nocardioides antri]KAA1429298.1 metallophosphoesterase [Nocardioides antri]
MAGSGVDRKEIRREEFVHLVDLSHDRVLIAWGAFWFRRREVDAAWVILDDSELEEAVGRRTCIGHGAEPFGETRVEVLDASGEVVGEARTTARCWAWVEGLEHDTEYAYRILVDGEEWAAGQRWDWVPSAAGGYDLEPAGSYDLRFRTFPAPDSETPAVRFVAVGDYGVGIRSDSESSRRQRRIAEVLDTLVRHHDARFVVSLGDNIYLGEQGQVDDESGGEDDDWYSSFFQPYRYVISRVPVYPAIGNHDTTDTEGSDDRAQMEDNFHVHERFRHQQDRASVGPGLFYRLSYGRDLELICIDTSQDEEDAGYHRFFQVPDHLTWLEEALSVGDPTWRIPFSHHPMFCAGPTHENDREMLETLLPVFERGGVRLALAGHEHNFQVSEVDGRTYVVSGSGGKLREDLPEGFEEAHTTAWAAQAHLLLVEIDGEEARLTPVSGLLPDGSLHLMTALNRDNEVVRPPLVVRHERA